jgi:hydrophobic/amphiphilic exporter-1 (mainly G- bacteria), HAE1 family
VPPALLGTVVALIRFGAANNLFTNTQIGLILPVALSAKNAILIVEHARDRRPECVDVPRAAVERARLRFRPIIMTSFAFILGVFPLVIATARAPARTSIGIAVFHGMISSTCLVVVFVSLLLYGDAAIRGAKTAQEPGQD